MGFTGFGCFIATRNGSQTSFLDVMAKEDKILKYMDLPLQHCNGQVLKSMNRHGDRESLASLIQKIREKVPGIVLRTTFLWWASQGNRGGF